MHIEKSFQLLSADNSKQAADETSFQNAGDVDAEFGDLLSVELESQEQQSRTGNDKKTGQEVAALLLQPTKVATENLDEGALVALVQAEKTSATGTESTATDSTDGGSAQPASTVALDGAIATHSQADAADFATGQASHTNPWLTIIHQSNDFNAILSQNSVASLAPTPGESKLSAAELLVTEVLGLPTPGQTATADALVATNALTKNDSTEPAAAVDDQLVTKLTANGTDVANLGDTGKVPTDGTQPNIVLEQQSASAQSADVADVLLQTPTQAQSSANSTEMSRAVYAKQNKMPGEQMEVLELVKTDKPHQLNQDAAIGEQQIATAEQVSATTAVLNTAAEQSNMTEQSNTTDQEPATANAAVASTTRSEAPQRPRIEEAIIAPVVQPDSKGEKLSPTNPGDLELPIDMSPGYTVSAAVPTAVNSATVMTPGANATAVVAAKTASPSFAQFQKAVNAAASLVQKQQAEQTQNLPPQELIAQQPAKFAELSVVMSGQHTDTPTAFNALLQTERPISSSGSAMGSSTGQQQHQAASQLFAAKLNDHVTSNEQPSLNLLEPSAATQLKERVMFQVNQKIQSAEIRLAPEELGSMQIKVQMQQEQLSVQFVVQQAGAKEALEQQMPRLRDMLEEQGIELTQGQVSQQREGSAEQRQTRERHQGLDQGPDIGDEPLQQQAMVRVSDRMVDYYA